MQVYLIAEAFCFIIGLLFCKSILAARNGRLILLYVIISVLTDYTGYVISRVYHSENGLLFNFYDVFKYLFIISYFRLIIKSMPRISFLICCVVYLAALLFDITQLESPHDLMIYSTIIGDLILVFAALTYFRASLLNPEFQNIIIIPDFWVSIAVLIYFIGVLPYHLSWKFLVFKNVDTSGKLYVVLLAILIALHYLFFSVSFVLWRFQKKI